MLVVVLTVKLSDTLMAVMERNTQIISSGKTDYPLLLTRKMDSFATLLTWWKSFQQKRHLMVIDPSVKLTTKL